MVVNSGGDPINSHKLELNTEKESEIKLSVDNYDFAKSYLLKVIKPTQKKSSETVLVWISYGVTVLKKTA